MLIGYYDDFGAFEIDYVTKWPGRCQDAMLKTKICLRDISMSTNNLDHSEFIGGGESKNFNNNNTTRQ